MNLVLEDVPVPMGGSDHELDSMTTEQRDVTEMIVLGKFLWVAFFRAKYVSNNAFQSLPGRIPDCNII